jgi:hypothetical protein
MAEEKIKYRQETNNTIILAIATLCITWCSYQSSLWNGIQTFRLADAGKYNRVAQQKAVMVGQRKEMDEKIIIEFVSDVYANKTDRIQFYIHRVRPQLASVMQSWMLSDPLHNSSAPLHPMATKEYEDIMEQEMAESKNLVRKGDESSEIARKANAISDNYSLYTVVFSMVMFLGAITTRLAQPRLAFVIILISGLICVLALILLFYSMPLANRSG